MLQFGRSTAHNTYYSSQYHLQLTKPVVPLTAHSTTYSSRSPWYHLQLTVPPTAHGARGTTYSSRYHLQLMVPTPAHSTTFMYSSRYHLHVCIILTIGVDSYDEIIPQLLGLPEGIGMTKVHHVKAAVTDQR